MKKILFYDREDAGKLHCDSCGYDLPSKQPFTESLIGTKCPKCRANMLSRRDFEGTMRLFRCVDALNRWLGPVFGKETRPKDAVKLAVRYHDGRFTLRRSTIEVEDAFYSEDDAGHRVMNGFVRLPTDTVFFNNGSSYPDGSDEFSEIASITLRKGTRVRCRVSHESPGVTRYTYFYVIGNDNFTHQKKVTV